MRARLLIIGNGMAPLHMQANLVERDPDRFDMTFLNAERRVNFNRLMLSHVLSGEKRHEKIITHDEQWHAVHGTIGRRPGPSWALQVVA